MIDTSIFDEKDANRTEQEDKVKENKVNIITFDYLKLKQDHGIEKLKLVADGEYLLDFLPFPISKGHPDYKKLSEVAKKKGVDPIDWWMSVWMHKANTPVGRFNFICPAKTLAKPCFFCEEKQRLFNEKGGYKAHEEEIKALNDVRRDFFLVLNREDERVYILEYANFFFGEKLEKKLSRLNGTSAQINLPHIGKDGTSLHFWIESGTFKDSKGNATPGHINEIEFIGRKEAISKEVIEHLPTLDRYLVEYSYDDMVAFHDGTYFANTATSDEDDDDAVSEKIVIGTKAKRESKIFNKEEVETPKEKPIREEPAEEKVLSREERKRQREKRSVEKCPAGGKIGKDIDSFDECDSCSIYDTCDSIFENLNKDKEDLENIIF